jgi:uncharacterized membrane protein YedE/YeeE
VTRVIVAFFAGILFAIGLALAGMTQPQKVVAFLDFTGAWDPSLAFVMGGAVVVYTVAFRLIMAKRPKPVFEPVFSVPQRKDITVPLIIGSVLFGAGWGLAGFCPAPAITALSSGSLHAVMFVVAMLAGMGLFRVYEVWRSRAKSSIATAKVENGSTP